MRNMKTLNFTVEEYRERVRKTKESMMEKGIDCLIQTYDLSG